MCGIIGYVGEQNALPIIFDALKRLEYRGYDSAGFAVVRQGQIIIRRCSGKVADLIKLNQAQVFESNIGIGHTRWATHGEPSERNAHPHRSKNGCFALVHNGIVENFLELKGYLRENGYIFHSDTDTEVIVCLLEKCYTESNNLIDAFARALSLIEGSNGLVVMSSIEPGYLFAARKGNAGGLVVGYGDQGNYICSDVPALIEKTRRVSFLDSGQIALVGPRQISFYKENLTSFTPTIHNIEWDASSGDMGKYQHYMHKEIHDQRQSILDTISGRVNFRSGKVNISELNLSTKKAQSIQKIFIVACGTAAHAGMVGKLYFERIAKIPVEVQIASEFRYGDPIIPKNSVVLAISQSGETADTLAAIELAQKMGVETWSIVNVLGSQASRIVDHSISMRVGPEIGVASTKAYTAPIVDMFLVALALAGKRGLDTQEHFHGLRQLPDVIGRCIDREQQYQKSAELLVNARSCLYLGRGINLPTAYEGALKLKEISYIHAEAYPAGELKHGPIAIVDRNVPSIVIATKDPWREKIISQIEQLKSRGGPILVVANDGDVAISRLAQNVIWVPETAWMISPVVNIIPLQLLAYYVALARNLEIDQPRNLAKSVTVE